MWFIAESGVWVRRGFSTLKNQGEHFQALMSNSPGEGGTVYCDKVDANILSNNNLGGLSVTLRSFNPSILL